MQAAQSATESQVWLVYCTCPEDVTAARLATTLVQERLAACANRIPAMSSTYRWQGAVHTDTEVLLLLKTTAQRYPDLERRIQALHPYELPEIVAVPVQAGLPGYLAWVAQSVSGSTDASD